MANPGHSRPPAVAGRFYPGDPGKLKREVAAYLDQGADAEPRHAAAVMAPHAGYVYSGGVAGQVFAQIHVPETVIILCPNHTGMGRQIAVGSNGSYRIPGAEIRVDEGLATRILSEVKGACADWEAHRDEHAIEVELPFLLARQPKLRIVPIVLGGLSETEAIELGRALHRAVEAEDSDTLLVASSDMSHFLTDAECRAADKQALEPLLAFDPSGLYNTVRRNDISMCGYIPATAMLSYAQLANTPKPELAGYATSGDAFGDRSRVVGYAGVVVPK